MRTYLYLLLTLIIGTTTVTAQNTISSGEAVFNPFLVYPSRAGNNDFFAGREAIFKGQGDSDGRKDVSRLNMSYRNIWITDYDVSGIITATYDKNFNSKNGIGFTLTNENYRSILRTGFSFTYAKHISLGEKSSPHRFNMLSFGAKVKYLNQRIDLQGKNIKHIDDPGLLEQNWNGNYFNFDFGTTLRWSFKDDQNLIVDASVLNLISAWDNKVIYNNYNGNHLSGNLSLKYSFSKALDNDTLHKYDGSFGAEPYVNMMFPAHSQFMSEVGYILSYKRRYNLKKEFGNQGVDDMSDEDFAQEIIRDNEFKHPTFYFGNGLTFSKTPNDEAASPQLGLNTYFGLELADKIYVGVNNNINLTNINISGYSLGVQLRYIMIPRRG